MRLSGAVLCLIAAVPVRAGVPAKAKPGARITLPAVAASTAAFAYSSTSPLTVDGVLAHFERIDAAMVSLSARFSQSMTMAETGVTSRVEGTVAYKKADRLRIEHLLPERQTVVSDGKDIWIHRHDRQQVVQSALADWKKADPAVANLMEFGSYGRMLKAYDVSLDTSAAHPALVLTPKAADASGRDFSMRLSLDPKTLFPENTDLKVGSLTVRTAFSTLRFNPILDDKSFVFTPPADADVFRDFKPPKFEP
ncbi:MAG: outer membrane lipoprotein carrier protein LolA [Elusimicrobia bacterium]|nr:outer membrane lipoprotein carrier protein LolA [Elusimicrobiota bacterium]